MITGISIPARLGSSRLSSKHLLKVAEKPLMYYQITRITNEFRSEIDSGEVRIIITTTIEPENKKFEIFKHGGIEVFYGTRSNIPLRQLDAMKYFSLDNIISVDGDDILCSVQGMRDVYGALAAGRQYVKTVGLPLGMNSMGYTKNFLERSVAGHESDILETGWGRIFDNNNLYELTYDSPKDIDIMRLTLDYEKDYLFFKSIVEKMGEDIYTNDDELIINFARENRLFEINSDLSNEFWENFHRNMANEADNLGSNCIYQQKAHKYIPAGSHTYSRADDSYPLNAPPVLDRGKAAYVWDIEGNKYLDFGMGLRSVSVGYDFERISAAAIEQIHKGNNLTRPSKIEVEAAETLVNLIPWVEMVKFAKNGSTVTTAAIKLARAYNSKKYVAKCAQHPFFSYDDWFIGDTIMDLGVPEENKVLTLNFNYNDIASLEELFSQYPNEIAAVILEPASCEEPKDDFLQKVKAVCHKNNAVFILDEMITGFRWDLQGASKYYDVEPDLVTYGKGMANGFSVAALGGKKEIMNLGGIQHTGERFFLISTTHGAEMCGLGAFVETMKVYQDLDVIGNIWNSGKKLMDGMNSISNELQLSDYFSIEGPPCSPCYLTRDHSKSNSLEFRTLFMQEMIKNGVLMPWISPSYSHRGKEIEFALDASRKSLTIYKAALEGELQDYLQGRSIKPVFRKNN